MSIIMTFTEPTLKPTQSLFSNYEKIKLLLVSMGIKEELIRPNSNLYSDLGFDLMDQSDLILLVERYFGIRLEEELASSIMNLSHLDRVIFEKQLSRN